MAGCPKMDTILAYVVEADGTVTNFSVKQPSGNADWDAAFERDISEWHYTPANKDGQPVAVRTEAKSACQ